MCDPLTITGAVLAAGSVAANSAAASQVKHARLNALNAERTRQQGFDQESQGYNTHSQDLYQDFGGQESARAQQLGDYLSSNGVAAPTADKALPVSSSNIVVNEQNKQNAKADAFTQQQGQALGDLRAFGDVLGSAGRSTARDAGMIGEVNGFKRGSQGVLPFELDSASNAGNGMKGLADMLQGIGGVAMTAGLSGASLGSLFGKGAATATGAPASLTSGLSSPIGVPRLGALY